MTATVQPRRRAAPRLLPGAVPPALRPALRAFLLGYASTVGPRLVSLLARYVKSKRAASKGDGGEKVRVADSLRAVLASGFGWNRFPAFCALFLGGSTILEVGSCIIDFHTDRFALMSPPGPLPRILIADMPDPRFPSVDCCARFWAQVSQA